MLFCIWLLSFNILFIRSIHVVTLAVVNSFSLFYNISIEEIHSNLFFSILLLMDIELFPVSIVTKITAINTDMSFAYISGAYLQAFLEDINVQVWHCYTVTEYACPALVDTGSFF